MIAAMSNPRRICLILLRAMGDVVLTTPAVRVLKKRFPDAQIDFITNRAPAEILTGNPNLHQVIVYPYRPEDVFGAIKFSLSMARYNYDIVIDFLGTPATALMTWCSRAPVRIGYNLRMRRFAYTHLDQGYVPNVYNPLSKFPLLKPLGILEEETETEVYPTAEAEAWVDQLFAMRGWERASVVALATSATNPVRRWIPERFVQVAKWLRHQGQQVVLVWGPGEEGYVNVIQRQCEESVVMSPKTTLMQLAALLKRCRLLVANCGGVKHVAVAVGTPTLTIHGPSDPRVWTPSGDPRHAFVRGQLDCLKCDEKECKTIECMEAVSVDQVINAITAMRVLG